MKHLNLSILLLLSTACCQHLQGSASQEGSHAILGVPHRQCDSTLPRAVICDRTLTKSECDLVQEAAEQINITLGHDFYVNGGQQAEPELSIKNIIVGYTPAGVNKVNPKLKTQTALETHYKPEDPSGCIGETFIWILLPIKVFSYASINTMLRHEFGHTLGLPHQPQGASGLMQSGFDDTLVEPIQFNQGELRVLKAVYPYINPEALR